MFTTFWKPWKSSNKREQCGSLDVGIWHKQTKPVMVIKEHCVALKYLLFIKTHFVIFFEWLLEAILWRS